MEFLLKALIILILILLLTFLQKYYYKILFKIRDNIGKFGVIINIIVRFGVIIHEVCHMIFGIIGGNKIEKVELFRKDGGRVIFRSKNYIGAIGQNSHIQNYFIYLFFNQIGLFLTSIGPLIFGISINILIINYFNIDIYNLGFENITLGLIIFIIFYSILIPSFVLSYQDIKGFIVSKQESIGATIIGSAINLIIFTIFLLSLVFLFEYFVVFSFVFLIYLLIFFWIFTISFLIKLIIKK